MPSLNTDIQQKKNSLSEFYDLAIRILNYLPDVFSEYEENREYRIYSSQIAGTIKYVRPINNRLFIYDPVRFFECYNEFTETLENIKNRNTNISNRAKDNINKIVYTIQQSIGAGLDLLVNPNSARKHVGNRFEELLKVLFTEAGIANKKTVLQIPYDTDEGQKVYKCENDLILSPYKKVKSTSTTLNQNEIVVSIKTTSKDRMGKIFIDKILLEKFVDHPQKVIGVFLNDVQRKGPNSISYTLVSGLFMVYSKFLTQLEGIYYIDLPPKALNHPYNKYMKPFSELLVSDIWNLLTP